MSDLLCVTSRTLCREPFLSRIEKIAQANPAGIILREKDLPEETYMELAGAVLRICQEYQVPCILHTCIDSAIALGADAIHLPLPLLRSMSPEQKSHFTVLGASCHSIEDALEAQQLGCTYITAGHIFATDCKKGVPPRGTDFLKQVCESVSIPVYAIGGIRAECMLDVHHAGARGACVMSGAMTCEDVEAYMEELMKSLNL